MTYLPNQIPNFVILPADRIPKYAENYDGGEIVLKQKVKEAFHGREIVWMNQVFIDIWDCKAKYQVLKGGSGAGKSRFVATRLLIRSMVNPYFRCLYVRKSFSDIKKSCFQLLKDIINERGWDVFFTIKESDYEIICNKNGNKFIPSGLDDVEKLKSIEGITDVWLEEAITEEKKVTDEEFRELVRRVRTPKADLHFYITFNPVDKDNFIYRTFVQNKKYPEYDPKNFKKNSFIIHTSTYEDNFFLGDDVREEYDLLKEEDYDEWLIYAKAEWGTPRSGNEYLYKFRKDVHVFSDVRYEKRRQTLISIDFNINPYITALVMQLHVEKGKRVVSIIDEVCLEHPYNDIDSLVYELKERGYLGFDKYVRWICDATGKNRIPGFGDKKEVIPYNRLKLMMKMYCPRTADATHLMKKNPSKVIAKSALNKIFANLKPFSKVIHSNIEVRVSDKCVKTIEEFSYLKNGDDGFDNERTTVNGRTVEKRGHIMSTAIYGFRILFKEYFQNKTSEL